MKKMLRCVLVLLGLSRVGSTDLSANDPRPVIYPGQVNLGLLADIHGPGRNGTVCGQLHQGAVMQAMATVWAAHQINNRKEANDLNIGVYIYDTCGREDVAQRQTFRILQHVIRLQPASCLATRVPPIVGVISQGDSWTLRYPSKMLDAFSLTHIITDGATADDLLPTLTAFSTTPSAVSQARAIVSVLERLSWKEVAVVMSDQSKRQSDEFHRMAMLSGIRSATLLPPYRTAVLKPVTKAADVVQDIRRLELKATVLFMMPPEALEFARAYLEDNTTSPLCVLVTSASTIGQLQKSFTVRQLLRLQNLLMISPVTLHIPEFHSFFQETLKRDSFAKHPLIAELLASFGGNGSVVPLSDDVLASEEYSRGFGARLPKPAHLAHLEDSKDDVSAMVKAVWSLSWAFRNVQRRWCRRGTDCLTALRNSLASQVLDANRKLSITLRGTGVQALEGDTLQFTEDGLLATSRFNLHVVSSEGELTKVGWYTDATGLVLDEVAFSSASEHMASVTWTGPTYSRSQVPSQLRVSSMSAQQEPSAPRSNSNNFIGAHSPKTTTSSRMDAGKSIGSAGVERVHVVDTGLAVWLGRPWALVILGLCGAGILVTVYVMVFLMVKTCEGALKRAAHILTAFHLVSLFVLYAGAALFTFKPTVKMCGAVRFIHDVAYTFCYACLLLQAMCLRSQRNIGLGGRPSRLNQIITLLFVVGLQVALEIQVLVYRPPTLTHEAEGLFCSITTSAKGNFLLSQTYNVLLLALTIAVAFLARNSPYNQRHGQSIFVVSVACLPIFVTWVVTFGLLNHPVNRAIAASLALVLTATVTLGGIFGPLLYTIHKYGGVPHKALSYTDSLSTVFTMFKDLDNISGGPTTPPRGKKGAKSLEPQVMFREPGMVMRNPLYGDSHSAYP